MVPRLRVMNSSLRFLFILVGTFAVSHFFFSLVEKAEKLPEWLNPVRAALIFTFMIELLVVMNHLRSGIPIDAP